MDNNWAIKREARYQKLLAASGISFTSQEAEIKYRERVSRIIAAYRVTEPDRVPVMMPVGSTPAYLAGTDLCSVMYDYPKLLDAWARFHREFEMDSYLTPASILPANVYDILRCRQYVYPGNGLSKTSPNFQFHEGEYMFADEYDALIKNPSDFWMRTYLPRAMGIFESFTALAPYTNFTEQPAIHFLPYAKPEVQQSLNLLIDVGNEVATWQSYINRFTQWARAEGFPGLRGGGLAKAPFDIIGDTLRGTQGVMIDMYRQPEKLMEAINVITDIHIDQLVGSVKSTNALTVQFALHKGADGFMSQKQFDTFYWPSLKKIILALLDEGVVPVMFAEGDYTSRLDSINEFPKGAVVWFLDKTDMKIAKRKIGGKCCLQGNVPTSLLMTGTPEKVKDHCRRLIEDCGDGGGYILACGASIDRGNATNLKAMSDAVREYGWYRD